MSDDAAVDLRVPIAGEDDIVAARQAAREAAKRLGFGVVNQSRIATAVSELARNVVRYATGGRGIVTIHTHTDALHGSGIKIVVSDDGPGITDINLALGEGFTTGHGMGLGLPGTRRLMDQMEIDSALGRGTTITICKWRR